MVYDSQNNSIPVFGTYSYTDAGVEQTVFEVTGVPFRQLAGIAIDLAAMTQNGTIRVYQKIDGTNYRLISTHTFTVATDAPGVLLDVMFCAYRAVKITYQEAVDETAARAIPYCYVLES